MMSYEKETHELKHMHKQAEFYVMLQVQYICNGCHYILIIAMHADK